jgi:hypothetical protein
VTRHFEILCDRDSRKAIPVLKQMVERLKGSTSTDAADLKTQCTGLETTQRNVRLLEQLALATPRKRAEWDKLCGLVAPALVSAVVAIDAGPPSTD